ncbi:unnamed protein product [Prorocentrum cordatum]|uniref:Uncharacterized protein n=1 Tax=Prorocentrum cordatum TaxID=2364126 RepID=A0ABN9RVV7_9DINO|nr:unnamed protein product [Polarella glacialis]
MRASGEGEKRSPRSRQRPRAQRAYEPHRLDGGAPHDHHHDSGHERDIRKAKGSQDPDGEVTMSGVEAAAGGIPGITLSAADRARAAAGAALLQKAAAAEGPRKKYSTHRLELGGRASIELITRLLRLARWLGFDKIARIEHVA